MATHHHLNFRLRGIPTRYETRIDVRELVKGVLSIEPGASVIIHSLVDNPIEPDSHVATLSFHTIPDALSDGSRNEWPFTLPTSNATCEDEFGGMDYLVFDTHFTGFTPLQHTKAENCHVNLIAISGLGGHAFGSFKERGGPFMWLRDVLPFDFPGARILIYGYDTQIEQSVSFQNLADLGKALGIDLRSLRGLEEDAAIIFIGHSLGGLVIKEATTNLHEAMDKQSASILHSVSGFLFFGVPHQGMAIESLVPLVMNNPNRSLLESLNKNSAVLQSLERKFSNIFGAKKPEIFSFYETEKSPTAIKTEKGKWELSGPPEVLVDVSSATSSCNERYPINRNHSELVKYHNRYDGCYVRVRSVLEPLLGKESRLAFESKKAEHSVSLSDDDWESLRSLSFREQESRYLEIHSANETCEWLLQEPEYHTWMNKSHGLFWIKGNPGAGKSVLMKFAFDEMKRRRSGGVVASFFIHGRGVLLQKTPLGVLRALLSSILKHFSTDLSRVTERFKDYQKRFGSYVEGRWDWTQQELEDFMSHALTKGTKSPATVIFIDALDECGESHARGLFAYFKHLMEAVERKGGRVQICISSRHYPILGMNSVPTISVEERNDADIRFVVQELLREIQPRAKRQEIEKQILLKAQGGFLWAIMVTQRVMDYSIIGTKDKKLFEQLTTAPETLDELYTDILRDSTEEERFQMNKLFQWVLFAERPLSSQELREAIATDKDMICTTVSQLRDHDSWVESLDQFEIYVKHITKGLVGFQTREVWELYEPDGEPWDREAQFIHQSVADYILKNFLRQYRPSNFATQATQTPIGAGHFEISRSCLRYIMLKEVLEGSWLSRGSVSAKFPLLPYMIRFFFHHIRKVEEEGITQTDLIPILWDNRAGLSDKIASLWRILDPDSAHTPNGWPFFSATPLHFLVASGSKSAFDAFLQERPEIDGKDSEGNTPLLLAIREQHLEMALTLLQRGIQWQILDVNVENQDGDTPLTVALATKAGELILRLLEAGANLALPCGEAELIFYAIRNRDEALFVHLLKRGIQLDGAIYFIIQELSYKDKDEILEGFLSELLSAGAEIRQSSVFRTLSAADGHNHNHDRYIDSAGDDDAILLASRRGQTSVVITLLSHDVSANYSTVYGQTPLYTALAAEQLDIARLLLEKGANPNSESDEYGQTPLSLAFSAGHLDIARLLLEKGADWAVTDNNGWTLLNSASNNGHTEMVQLVLENGADRIVATKNGIRLLISASAKGHIEIVKMLFDKGADWAVTDNNGWTPLNIASNNGHTEVVKLLLEKGADSTVATKDGWTPLNAASWNGHTEVVKILIDNGADVNVQGEYGSALQIASSKGYNEIVRILTDNGADVNATTYHHCSALQAASSKGYNEIVRILIDNGADVNATAYHHASALQAASFNRNREIVQILVDNGAKVNAYSGEYGSALQAASSNGYGDIVQILISNGADVNAQGGKYGNALHAASSQGHQETVKLLTNVKKNHKSINLKRSMPPFSAVDVVQKASDEGTQMHSNKRKCTNSS